MTAKEMFGKLGYKLQLNKYDDELRYEKHFGKDKNEFYVIEFENKDWASFIVDSTDGFRTYNNQEHIKNNLPRLYKAICQQMKELRELDET